MVGSCPAVLELEINEQKNFETLFWVGSDFRSFLCVGPGGGEGENSSSFFNETPG